MKSTLKHMRGKQSWLKTGFTRMLIEANMLDHENFRNWIFCPGMLFGSPDKWWGDHGIRDFPHEGIDLCLYADRTGRICRLDEQTRIPVIQDGMVKAMFTDYLGRAIILEHQNELSENKKILSVYAHTKPIEGIRPGAAVKKGDVIATIADTSSSKAKILPHLHLSLGIPSPTLPYESFVWNIMRNPMLVTLLDPHDAVDWASRVLKSDNCYCLEI